MTMAKLGYQSGVGLRVASFDNISFYSNITTSDLAYSNAGFVYNQKDQNKLLYNGQPCIYTDVRYLVDQFYPQYIYKSLRTESNKTLSLKACKRRVNNTFNIPIGTIVTFSTDWHYKLKPHVDTSYKYKVKQSNLLDIKYEINNPLFTLQFTSCVKSQLLTDALRAEGFIVRVVKEDAYHEYAMAYGYNNKIAYSSENNQLMNWYSCGCDYILYEQYDKFNKWLDTSGAIHKDTPINDIVHMLKQIPTKGKT